MQSLELLSVAVGQAGGAGVPGDWVKGVLFNPGFPPSGIRALL